ncbi:MAG: ABC transporter permease [Clostridia bacterium]|nr:ABC transporter permease [Clostridia bacterium]
MKKFIDLVKNESLKLWGQTSFRVLTIILAVILVLTPIFNFLIYELLGLFEFGTDYEEYLDRAAEARESGEELEAIELETLYEAEKYFADKGLDGTSAEYSIYYFDYEALLLARSSLSVLSEGKFSLEELNDSYYTSLDQVYLFLVDYGLYEDTDAQGYYQYNVLTVVKSAIDERGIDGIIAAVDTELTNLRFNIENFSMKFYYEQMLASARDTVKSAKAELESTKIRLESDLPEADRKYYEAYSSYCEDVIMISEGYEKAIEIAAERNCKYNSWEYLTVANLAYNAVSSTQNSYPMTDSEFSESYYTFQYSDASEYSEEMAKERMVALEALDYALYSLEHSIPLPQALSTASTKNMIKDQFRSFAGILAILFICYGGITMAHEYSSGTIRLLLIKPRSRTKIFCSKITCLAFWWLAASLASLLVLTLENIVIFGINDVFLPDLKAMKDGISEIPSFLGLLGVFGEEFLMAMLYVTFALLFAVLTKKVALSILFPILVSFGASIIQGIAIALYEEGLTFLAYTPLFYLDFEFLHSTAVDYYMFGSNIADIISSSLNMASADIILGKHASVLVGIIMLSLLVAAFSAISVATFRKQKI